MLEATKKLKELEEEKKKLEEAYAQGATFDLKCALIQARAEIRGAKAERAKALAETRRARAERKKQDPEFVARKKALANKGRERRYYFVRTPDGRTKKMKSVGELMARYANDPDASYFVLIKYSGDKVVDGVKARERELTREDMLLLE